MAVLAEERKSASSLRIPFRAIIRASLEIRGEDFSFCVTIAARRINSVTQKGKLKMRKLCIMIGVLASTLAAVGDDPKPDGGPYQEVANGIEWTFMVKDGKTAVGTGTGSAVPSDTSGSIVIPNTLGGRDVIRIEDKAFYFCRNLCSVTLPTCLEEIGQEAFWMCESLTTIEVPPNVHQIGRFAFACGNLQSIVVSADNKYFASSNGVLFDKEKRVLLCTPDGRCNEYAIPTGTIELGDYAFYYCRHLPSVTIPETVTNISNHAFFGCSSLMDIALPSSVTNVGERVFYDCSSLTNAVLPKGITDLNVGLFQGCSKLSSIALPPSVTSIGEAAFGGCAALTNIFIPTGVLEIVDCTFSGCTSLTNVMIHSDVRNIGQFAFSGCAGLVDLTLPAGIKTIGYGAFRGCTSLMKIELPSGMTWLEGEVFSGCSGLTCVRIPGSITMISQSAFEGCTVLPNISLPTNVSIIGEWAFRGCDSINDLIFPSSIGHIGQDAFANCSNLNTVTFEGAPPSGMANIGFSNDITIRYNVAYANEWLPVIAECGFTNATPYTPPKADGGPYTEVVNDINWTFMVANGESSVGRGAWNQPAVSKSTQGDITIPTTLGGHIVTHIGAYAFENCDRLTCVNISDSIKDIGDFSFWNCSSLTNVVIPEGVGKIGMRVFVSCNDLIDITIPATITNLQSRAIEACAKLKEISVSPANQYYSSQNGVLFNKDSTTLITFPCGKECVYEVPLSVTRIADYAFHDCDGLKGISIHGGVKSIGREAFSDCTTLSSVTISEGVASIGTQAFYRCPSLTRIDIPSSIVSIETGAFMQCDNLQSIDVSPLNEHFSSHDGVMFDKNCTILLSYPCGKTGPYTVPNGVSCIGNGAFLYCKTDDIMLPSSVKIIDDITFYGCGMDSLTIPSEVTDLGWHSLYDCASSINFEGAPPNGLEEAGLDQDAVIYYNVTYRDEWLPLITDCGWTNARPYVPEPKGTVLFIVPKGLSSVTSHIYTNETYGVLPEARREGCTFAGWYTSLDGTNRVSAFSLVNPNIKTLYARWVEDNALLYAQWEANRYSVTFNSNGGAGVMGEQPFLYDQSQALNDNAFTKVGYTFKGWATVADGDVVYKDGASVSNLTTEAEFAVALFAKWEKVIDVATEEVEEWVGYDLAPKFKKAGETNSQYRKRFETKYGDDYGAAFFMETGKVGMDGTRLCVWHDYVAGTDPLDEASKFTATVTIEDGLPVVRWTPALNGEGVKDGVRQYRVLGAKKLGGSWTEVNGDESDYNFFKVTVEMP